MSTIDLSFVGRSIAEELILLSRADLKKCPIISFAFLGVRAYTLYVTLKEAIPATINRRMVVDCRDVDFGMGTDSVLNWVMSFPSPAAMHIVLPSSLPEVRRLQCTLQSLGCAVSRVTKCIPKRF